MKNKTRKFEQLEVNLDKRALMQDVSAFQREKRSVDEQLKRRDQEMANEYLSQIRNNEKYKKDSAFQRKQEEQEDNTKNFD